MRALFFRLARKVATERERRQLEARGCESSDTDGESNKSCAKTLFQNLLWCVQIQREPGKTHDAQRRLLCGLGCVQFAIRMSRHERTSVKNPPCYEHVCHTKITEAKRHNTLSVSAGNGVGESDEKRT